MKTNSTAADTALTYTQQISEASESKRIKKEPQSELETYKKVKLLGKGAHGKAFLVKCGSDGSYAVIKKIDIKKLSQEDQRATFRESKILEVLNHPNIIRFREVYRTKAGQLCIVMDFADGKYSLKSHVKLLDGDLAEKIKDQRSKSLGYFSEELVLTWFTQICLAVKHIHDRKILHRDIKAQNVFLMKNGILKLGDFGIARVLNATSDMAATVVGTPYYLSPEIVQSNNYGFMTDIWSLGVLFYEMCALKPPFNGQNLHMLAMQIVSGCYQPLPDCFSSDVKNLIKMMLMVDDQRRPTINQLLRMPALAKRAIKLMSDDLFREEFSHTVLHKHNVFEKVKKQRDQQQDLNEEEPLNQDITQSNQSYLLDQDIDPFEQAALKQMEHMQIQKSHSQVDEQDQPFPDQQFQERRVTTVNQKSAFQHPTFKNRKQSEELLLIPNNLNNQKKEYSQNRVIEKKKNQGKNTVQPQPGYIDVKRQRAEELEKKKQDINKQNIQKQLIEEKRKLEKKRAVQEQKLKLKEDQEKLKIERDQEREAMRQDFLRKKKILAETNETGVSFEIVGVPQVLLQSPQPQYQPNSEKLQSNKLKAEAFVVNLDSKNSEESKTPDKYKEGQSKLRRRKADRDASRDESALKKEKNFGEVEILVSEKDKNLIEQRKQQEVKRQADEFSNYKEMIERALKTPSKIFDNEECTDANSLDKNSKFEEEDYEPDFNDLIEEMANDQADQEQEREDDPAMEENQIEINFEEQKQQSQVQDVEERPQKPNNISYQQRKDDDTWLEKIDKFGRQEFNLIYQIMEKYRQTRFSIDSQTKILAQAKQELPKISKKQLDDDYLCELIGTVSTKMYLEDFNQK